ncbi:MAG TPA: family 43 glycosylhydrolase, partial [Opitutus sp.]|nr:family 43 glycosylhydrolase [Opitutus sp.]
AFGSWFDGIQIVPLDPATMKPSGPVEAIARRQGGIEGPNVVYAHGYYYLVVSIDRCCQGVNSTYKIAYGRSREITGPYVDKTGTSLLNGGGTVLEVGETRWRGPGGQDVYRDGDRSILIRHSYDANANGTPKLRIADLYWDAEAWPTYATSSAPVATVAPANSAGAMGSSVTLGFEATGADVSYRWRRNGTEIAGANSSLLTLANVQPADAGIYTGLAANNAGSATTAGAVVGGLTTGKVVGSGQELQPTDIRHPNGNIFDQVLLTGSAEAITADFGQGQVTRTSYIDLDDDIVQVELSGPGTLTLVLDASSGPARPTRYNQTDVQYMKGHASIVVVGADERTNVSVFTVGRATAFDRTNQFKFLEPISATNNPANNGSPLFEGHGATDYDGIADIAFIAIASANGKFGGVRTSNANYFASKGVTGIYAPGVAFQGPVYFGDISAAEAATPMIVLGSASDVRVTGGDMLQMNGQAVQVSGITQLKFTAGGDSHGRPLTAQANRAVYQQNGADVTAQIVANP